MADFLKRLWEAIKAAPRWLWLALLTLVGIAAALAGRGSSTAQRHLKRSTHRAYNTAREHEADARNAAEAQPSVLEQHQEDVDAAGAKARSEVTEQQARRNGPGGRPSLLLLLLLPFYTPSPAPAQSAIVLAEVPFTGPCAPGTGRWNRLDGSFSCEPCPPMSAYATGVGDLPAGCPALFPGVLTEVTQYEAVERKVKDLEARDAEQQKAMASLSAQVTACEVKRKTLAQETSDALEACVELVEQPEGHSFWTVAGAGTVGVAVGVIIGALAL